MVELKPQIWAVWKNWSPFSTLHWKTLFPVFAADVLKPTQEVLEASSGWGAQPPLLQGPLFPPTCPLGQWEPLPRPYYGLMWVWETRSLWSRWNRLYSTEYTQSPLPMRPGTDCTEANTSLSPVPLSRPDHPAPSPRLGSSPYKPLQNPHLRWRKTQLVQGKFKVLSYRKCRLLHLPVYVQLPENGAPICTQLES